MAQIQTDEIIRKTAKHLFAKYGYDGLSMRILSKESGVGLSSIYHFFADKDVMLHEIYAITNRELGMARRKLLPQPTVEKTLEQLINFQFKHIEDIVYVLKYYLHYRHEFAAMPTRTLPPKSFLHIQEVIDLGRSQGRFDLSDSEVESKSRVIAHTINGYLLEYFPDVPDRRELQQITGEISAFATAGLVRQS